MKDALPGAKSADKTFTIKSEGGSGFTSAPYTIQLVEISNNITNEELTYSLSGVISGTTSASGTTVAKVTDGTITETSGTKNLGNGTITPGETHTYTFSVAFKETYSNQDSNQGKSFSAKLNVITGTGTTYYNASNTSGTTTEPSSEAE